MTRQEAIERIQDHIDVHKYREHEAVRILEVLDMAIEALRQPEPCEDVVSRHRLLSDLKELTAAWKKYPVMAEQIKGVEAAIGYVETIPSVMPKPEQRWIPCSERLPKKHGESYLVTISDGAVYTTTLQWDANGKRWYLSFFNDGNILVDFIDDVIAWLPLPEPYQAERWE